MLKIFDSNTVEASPFSLKSLCKGTKSSPPLYHCFIYKASDTHELQCLLRVGGWREAEVEPFIRGKFHLLCTNLFLWLGPVCLVLKSQS